MANQSVGLTVQPKLVATPESKIHGRVITTRVVGVTFADRQEVVAKVQMKDRIWLERETTNPFDANAIKVSRNNGELIGYLNRYLANNLAPYFDKHEGLVRGKVTLLTGGSFDDFSLGLVISFKIPKLTDTQRRHSKHQFDWEN